MITLKRAYDPVSATDGTRYLVERLWPRGVQKAKLRIDGWLKDVAPSTELRKWFSHDPARWDEFRRRYFRELDSEPEAWRPIVSAAGAAGSRLPFEIGSPSPAAASTSSRAGTGACGGAITAPALIHRVEPVYPPIAVQAQVHGVVILGAVVDRKGEVEDVRVLRSIPLLHRAAVDGVRQWRYSPLLLNGKPERFVQTVTVSFNLSTSGVFTTRRFTHGCHDRQTGTAIVSSLHPETS